MLLGVNIDHVATLRNARGGGGGGVTDAAVAAEKAGADAITVHLREDRRHIKDKDVRDLKEILYVRLNLEMAATDEMQKIALELLPDNCCIVPEKRQELTTEGGLDAAGRLDRLTEFVKPLVEAGIVVSLFIDPEREQIAAAEKTGAQYIELHTGRYSEAFGTKEEEAEFQKLKDAASYASLLGLGVNAGHGLNYENVHRMKEIENLNELNIGHNIIARALFTGLDTAVKEMKDLVK